MRQLDYAAIFWTLFSVKVGLTGMGFAFAFLFLWLNVRQASKSGLGGADSRTAAAGDPGDIYLEHTKEHGESLYDRTEAPATALEKAALERMSRGDIHAPDLAGEKILTVLTNAPGDGYPIGGIKVVAESGWFAARPSGTEDIYKIYAESFSGEEHLRQVEVVEAQAIVSEALATPVT
jgi:phosphoglucomutase